MNNDEEISELWSLRINPSDLLNIERPIGVGPVGGGGQTYIQIPMSQKQHILRFLRKSEPPDGQPLTILVQDRSDPGGRPQRLEFHSKSAGRMRIAKQNRHRVGQDRLHAWSPESGFPVLTETVTTDAARKLLADCGGLHIFLARTVSGRIWAGFTIGEPSVGDRNQPFASIAWGNSPGGHWIYKDDI